MELRLLIAALRRRLLLVLVVGVVGGLAGVTYAQDDEGFYQATAQLLLDPTAVVVPGAQQFTGDPERFVGGQIGVLRSRATAERAAESIGVSADEVSDTLTIERVVGSDVVDVIGRADSAELARDVANAVAESYVAQRREQSAAAVAAQLAAVDKEIAAVQQQVAALPRTPTQVNPRQQALLSQYEQLLQRRLTITAPGAVRDASAVLDPARLPEEPQRLSTVLAGAAGAVLGLLLGTAVAVLFEGRRPHVTHRLQVEHLLGRPVRTTFPAESRLGDQGRAERHAASVLLALVHAHQVTARRTLAVCATGPSRDAERLAEAVVDVVAAEGVVAQLIYLDAAVRADTPTAALPAGGRRKDREQEGLASLLVESPPAPRRTGAQQVLDALPADVDVAVVVLPQVLDDPSIAEVPRWATDVVLVVPLGEQSEHDLSLAHELLSTGPARLHPVLVTRRARAAG